MFKNKSIKELILYVIFGALTTMVSLLSYYLLKNVILTEDTQLNIQICTVISWILSVTFAYLSNRKYVFKSSENKVFVEALKFYLARVTTLIIDSLMMLLLTEIFNIDDNVAKIVVQVIILVINYLLSKFAIFRKKD